MPYVSLSKLSCRALNSEARTNTVTIVTPTTTNQMQTVLSVGAAGKIGASAIHAALSSEFHVLAMVRKHISAEKLFYNVGAHEGITTVEADIMSDRRVKGVVEKVRKGKLPVYAAGGLYFHRSVYMVGILADQTCDCMMGQLVSCST